MGGLAGAAGVLSSIGSIGDQAATGAIKAEKFKADQKQQALDALMTQLQMQHLQQQIKRADVPMSIGQIRLPSGQYKQVMQRANGELFTTDLTDAPDKHAQEAGLNELVASIQDPEGQKVARALYDSTLASTGGNVDAAMQAAQSIVSLTAKREMSDTEKDAQTQKRYDEGTKLGLKGNDLMAYAMNLKGSTDYQFTPGGKRALRPPAPRAGGAPSSPEDVATYAQGLAGGQIKWAQVPKKDVAAVLKFSTEHGMKMPQQPHLDMTIAKEVAEDHSVLAQAQSFMQPLAALRDNNQFGYFTLARAEYAAGRAPGNAQILDTISKLERFKYTAIQNTIKTRNVTLIQAIQQHLPDVWKDSPKLVYEKMQSFIDTIQTDADHKAEDMWVYPPEPGGAGAAPGAAAGGAPPPPPGTVPE